MWQAATALDLVVRRSTALCRLHLYPGRLIWYDDDTGLLPELLVGSEDRAREKPSRSFFFRVKSKGILVSVAFTPTAIDASSIGSQHAIMLSAWEALPRALQTLLFPNRQP